MISKRELLVLTSKYQTQMLVFDSMDLIWVNPQSVLNSHGVLVCYSSMSVMLVITRNASSFSAALWKSLISTTVACKQVLIEVHRGFWRNLSTPDYILRSWHLIRCSEIASYTCFMIGIFTYCTEWDIFYRELMAIGWLFVIFKLWDQNMEDLFTLHSFCLASWYQCWHFYLPFEGSLWRIHTTATEIQAKENAIFWLGIFCFTEFILEWYCSFLFWQ